VTPTGYHLGGVYSTPLQMLNGVSAMIFIDLMFWKTAAVSDSGGGLVRPDVQSSKCWFAEQQCSHHLATLS
jgi:hypothetical protein